MIDQGILKQKLSGGLLGINPGYHSEAGWQTDPFQRRGEQAHAFLDELSDLKSMQRVKKVDAPPNINERNPEIIYTQTTPEVAVFRRRQNEIIINEYGVFIPRDLFEPNAELEHSIDRSSGSGSRVTIFARERSRIMRSPVATKPIDCTQEMRWLAEHGHEYAGQWVALDGDHLLSHGENAREVYEAAHNAGVRLPLVVHIDPPNQLPFGGW